MTDASTWVVETRIPKMIGTPTQPWHRFALARTRAQARHIARIPRAGGYQTRVRQTTEARRWAEERGLAYEEPSAVSPQQSARGRGREQT